MDHGSWNRRLIDKTLAHHGVTGLLGKGGMSEVYRARAREVSSR